MTADSSPDRASPSHWRAAWRELRHLDWENCQARAALRCLPGFIVLLVAGLLTGRRADSAIAAAAALSVGFGSFQALRESRGRVMLLVAVVIAVAAFTGSIVSRSLFGVLTDVVCWALVYGLVTSLESGLTWVALQAVIIAVIAAGFPVDPHEALFRAFLTFAGGFTQAALILGIWRLLGPPKDAASGPIISFGLEPATAWHQTLLQHASPRSPVGRFAIQLCLTLLVAAALYRWLAVPNGYWIPMTAVILLRPEFHQTLARGLGRLLGTLLGVGLATLLVVALHPHALFLALLVVIFAWASYAVVRVNYGLFATCITAYVVFILAFMGLPEATVVKYRLINTTLGGLIALGVALIPLDRFFTEPSRGESDAA